MSALTTMPFGKYKGTPITELRSGYLEWLYDKRGEWYPPLRGAVEAEHARRQATTEPKVRTVSNARPAPPRELVCNVCGLSGTAERPLVHATCVGDDIAL